MLTACGGDDKPKADPSSSPTPTSTPTSTPTPTQSPTATPSGTAPAVTVPTLPEATKGKEGQQAFAQYVVDAWVYSISTNDPQLLFDLGAKKDPCKGCPELRAELDQRVEEGWSVAPFEVEVYKIRVTPADDSITASVTFDIPETQSFFDDGTLRNTSKPHDDATFTIAMRLVKKQYQLLGFTIN